VPDAVIELVVQICRRFLLRSDEVVQC
jgi:hypothetical protein